MNLFFVVFLTFCLHTSKAQYNKCTPDNEFEDGLLTPEWTTFTDLLHELTFQSYNLSCPSDESRVVSIDHNSDFLWTLRFDVYNQSFEEGRTTLDDCFKKVADCGEPFRDCMKEARQNMIDDLKNENFWKKAINDQLELLQKEECGNVEHNA